MTTKFHCCIALDKLLELALNGSDFMENNDGTPMSQTEIYDLVIREKAKDYKYYSACDNRDSSGRCMGHYEI